MDLSYIFIEMKSEKCHFWDLFPTFTNPQTNLWNTHFYFDIDCFIMIKKYLGGTFVLYSP